MKATPSQTVGPFFRFGLDWMEGAESGIDLRGAVHDADGPVPDAVIEVWASPRFARALTEPDGSYHLKISRPGPGDDGSAPHLDVSLFARGLLQRLVTRVYFPDEPDANAADPVLALVSEERRRTLVARPEPEGLRFDVHLRGPDETVFFAY